MRQPGPGRNPSVHTATRHSWRGLASFAMLALLACRPAIARDDPPASRPVNGYQRRVHTPATGASPRVVVTEFFTQGAVDPRGGNVRVEDQRGRPVPWRVLQVGPGDTCRLAFQPSPASHEYRILYGGPASAEPVSAPPWPETPGLLFEARRWRNCDLNRIDSVRQAFDAAEPIGADYIPALFLRFNPTASEIGPFLSRTTGTLRIDRPGRHEFFTSSQDASFLRIDGRLVVQAPGYHGPTGNTRFHAEVSLPAGPHAFEYLHGASGNDCCLVAAWKPPGAEKAEPIPPAAFGDGLVARLPAVDLQHVGRRLPREFAVETLGEVPLADSATPLVRVRFRVVASASSVRPHLKWSFGDGQVSTLTAPTHIYMHPGTYTVSLSAAGEPEGSTIVNRVPISRPLTLEETSPSADTLPAYLALVEDYDPATLDLAGLLALIRAEQEADRPDRAAKAGQAGLLGRKGVDDLNGLLAARMVGPLWRDRLDQPEAAAAFWSKLAGILAPESWRIECATEAADIEINDRLDSAAGRARLDDAIRLGRSVRPPGEVASERERVEADWQARQGDRARAAAGYARAAGLREDRRSTAEQDAWRGAFSRSAEAFLRDNQLDRARDELRRWQREFPADKAEGYLSLLLARERAARGKLAQAAAIAADLVAANPDSAYADRNLFLAADCDEKRGQPARAHARLQALLNDYPGSPLVPEARQRLGQLSSSSPTTKPK